MLDWIIAPEAPLGFAEVLARLVDPAGIAGSGAGLAGAGSRWGATAEVDLSAAAVVAVSLLVSLGLVIPARLWAISGVFVTVVHELGHALAALSRGRTGMRIRIRRDHSGLTTSVGHPDTVAWTHFWGYPVPALVGAGMCIAAWFGWAPLTVAVLMVIGLLTFVFMRGGLAVGLALFGLLTGAGLLSLASDALVTTAVLAAGCFLIAGGLRAIANLISLHIRRRAGDSDAAMLARATRIPAIVWTLAFLLVSLLPVLAFAGLVLTARAQ